MFLFIKVFLYVVTAYVILCILKAFYEFEYTGIEFIDISVEAIFSLV